jgi:hypothetical protein
MILAVISSVHMKTLLIAAVAIIGLFTPSLSANVLEDFVGSWKLRADAYKDDWKVVKATGTMRVSKLGKNSFSMVTTGNVEGFLDSVSSSVTSNDWMFPNGKIAGYSIIDGETSSVCSGTWKVSENKIVMTETTYSPGEKPESSSVSFTRKSSKRFDISWSDGSGIKYKGSITR